METPLYIVSRIYEGSTSEIGGILGLRTGKRRKKVTYNTFCNKMGTYTTKTLTNGEDVVLVTKTRAHVLWTYIF